MRPLTKRPSPRSSHWLLVQVPRTCVPRVTVPTTLWFSPGPERTLPTAAVIFENARVPVANRLGEEGDGFKIAMKGLDGGRLNIGACSLGGARASLEASLRYVKERRQFGQALADFQATQFKLADMATELEAARLLLHRAAASLDRSEAEATMHCAMAKRLATDIGFRVVNEALQLHGGYGYIREYPIERYLRDLRVHQILEGTNEIMRVIIARRLLNLSSTQLR